MMSTKAYTKNYVEGTRATGPRVSHAQREVGAAWVMTMRKLRQSPVRPDLHAGTVNLTHGHRMQADGIRSCP